MKTDRGFITILNENRLVDRIARFTYSKGLWNMTGYYPILRNNTGEEMGHFVCAYGNTIVIRILSWLTDYRGKDAINHEVEWRW